MTETKEENSDKAKYINKSLDKALRVLDVFNPEVFSLSISDMAEKVDVDASTLYPTIHTLARHGYLEQDSGKEYRLGSKILERSNVLLKELDLRNVSQPKLKDLSSSFNGNAHLAIPYGNKVMYLDREKGSPGVTLENIIGEKVPLYCTALGKSILAYRSEREISRYLDEIEMKPFTPNTITDQSKLKLELEKIYDERVAIDNEEFVEGNVCVASPLMNYEGVAVGSISISLPKTKLEENELEKIKSRVKENSSDISKELGFHQ